MGRSYGVRIFKIRPWPAYVDVQQSKLFLGIKKKKKKKKIAVLSLTWPTLFQTPDSAIFNQ